MTDPGPADWARAELTVAEIAPHRSRSWADVWRVEAAEGLWWLKVNRAGTTHEPALLRLLGGRPHPLVPRAIVHPDQPWSLIEDAGLPVREQLPGLDREGLVGFWCGLMSDYAELQRSLRPDELLRAGVPDYRSSRLPARYRELIARTEWFAPPAVELSGGRRAALDGLGPELEAVVGLLTSSGTGVEDSLQHDDLHDHNVLVDTGGQARRVIDWGDAVVSHPFGTLRLTLDTLAETLPGLPGDLEPAAGVARVRSAYLEGWRTGGTTEADLLEEARLVRWVECLVRAACWVRALGDLPTGLAAGYAGSPAHWLGWMVDERPEGTRPAEPTP